MEKYQETESVFERCPHDRENPYVMLNKEIFADRTISPKAKGVLGYLLTRPPNWRIYHKQLMQALDIGEAYLNSAIAELLKAGYLSRTRKKIKGKFMPYTYHVREFKKCFQTGFSGPENPAVINTEEENIEDDDDVAPGGAAVKTPAAKGKASPDKPLAESTMPPQSPPGKLIVFKHKTKNIVSIPEKTLVDNLTAKGYSSGEIRQALEEAAAADPVLIATTANVIEKYVESIIHKTKQNKIREQHNANRNKSKLRNKNDLLRKSTDKLLERARAQREAGPSWSLGL